MINLKEKKKLVYGWAGKILYINLTTGKVSTKPSEEYGRMLLGARGVNAKLFYEESKPNMSPYDPEAPLIFGAGVEAGAGLIGGSRMEVTGVSPSKTEEYSYGNVGMGGTWSPELKFAGYDNVVVTGRAKEPVYIFINNDKVEIKSAKGIWGKGIFATQDLIREQLGDEDVQVVSIGQAGENLAVYASIEQAYRSGTAMGAAMGAKNLKAVAVRGTKPVKVYDPEKILEYNQQIIQGLKPRWKKTGPTFGTEGKDAYMAGFAATDSGVVGDYESHAWRQRPDIMKAYEEGFIGDYYARPLGCFNCPLPCIPLYDIPDIGAAVWRCYAAFWPWKVWVTDMKVSFEAQRMMSDYGLESREIATDVSWLMHMYNDGVITAKDTDGIAFERGSKEAFFAAIRKIALREGFGDVLANGVLALAKKLGPKAQEYLIQNRGSTMRTFDFRLDPGTGLGEAIASRGNSLRATTYGMIRWNKPADPEWKFPGVNPEIFKKYQAWSKEEFGSEKAVQALTYEGKPTALIHEMDKSAVTDSLGLCKTMTHSEALAGMWAGMPDPSYKFVADRYTAITGIPIDEKALFKIGERVTNIERAIVVRDGRTRATDTLPEFFFKVGVADGPQKGIKLDKTKFEKMKDEYYQLRGWDVTTGVPTRAKLEELGLKDIADNLEKLGKLPKPQKT
jgi:aldehyde:ferredoxin oxidoreductase